MDIKSLILDSRNIKEKSAQAYVIILKKLNNNQTIENLDYLNDTETIIKKIKEKKLTTQRNYICAVLVALGLNDNDNDEIMLIYKKFLEELNNEYNKFIESHEKTESQKENWCTLSDLDDIRLNYKKRIRNNDYINKETLTKEEQLTLTYYMIVSLYTLLPPVRIDYAPMQIITDINDDNSKNNYLYIKNRNIKKFILNEYKTEKKYGKKIIDIPSKLNSVINLYMKFHSTNNSFLVNNRGNPMNSSELTKQIPLAFGVYTYKNVTLNLLRHIYVSEKVIVKSQAQVEIEEKLASDMCHSSFTQKTYYKN